MLKLNINKQSTSNKATLDSKHQEILNLFDNEKKKLPSMKKELIKLNNKYKNILTIPNYELTDSQLKEKFAIKDNINSLENNIKRIENNEEELKYFLYTSPILYNYYENIKTIGENEDSDEDDEINDEENHIDSIQKKNNTNNNTKNNILNFFSNIEQKNTEENTQEINEKIEQQTLPKHKISDYITTTENFQRANYRNQYLKIIDPQFVDLVSIGLATNEICNSCGIELSLIQSEGYMVCENCGKTEYIVIDADKPSYKEPPPEISYFAYKRMNHFNEILSQVQGKESTEIPKEVIEQIFIEIKKDRIKNISKISANKIKYYLKKLGYSKYYEHSYYIIYKITGKKPPTISSDIEEKLRKMFKEIQEPFSIVCPKNRKNFLSYSYVFHKFAELLGHDELKQLFPLLKSREKLHQQDVIWKGICHILQWSYIKSI